MFRRKTIRLIIDTGMTVLLLLLMAYQVIGDVLHEWFGIGMTVLLIVHHLLNLRWYASLFKGRYNAYRFLTAAVNTLLLASIALTALCGMSMSGHAVPFLYGMFPVPFARRFHLSMSYWSFLLMGLHLGIHLPAMSAEWLLEGKKKTPVLLLYALAAAAGLFFFLRNSLPEYLFFRTPFAFYEEKILPVVLCENITELLFFAFLGSGLTKVLRG